MKTRLLIIVIFVILISGCDQGVEQPIRWRFPLDIPKSDIIYNTISFKNEDDNIGRDVLGFYSFQNQTDSLLELPLGSHPIRPYFLNYETIITMSKMGNFGLVNEGRSQLFSFSKLQYLNCSDLLGVAYPYNGNIIFYNNISENLEIINSSDCTLLETVLNNDDFSKLVSKNIESYGVAPNTYSKNGDFVLMVSNDTKLFRISLPDLQIYDYKREGWSPTLSPDQKKIAYLARDGIHIMDLNGLNDELIVPYLSITEGDNGVRWSRGIIPIPNWSIDSLRLVYHKCNSSSLNCSDIGDYDIYTYDIETKQEELIIHGGLNPSWNYYKE